MFVDAPTCLTGRSYWKGCRCKVCKFKKSQQTWKYLKRKKAKIRQDYIKRIMRNALDVSHTFEQLCPQHRPDLLNLAKRYTGQEITAEDLVQDTMLKAYRHWSLFKQETTDLNKDVRSWLKRILTNTFYTEWQRDQKRNQMHEDYTLEWSETPDEGDHEEAERVRKVMDKLRPMYREVLELHYMKDKSYQEIADELGIKFVQVQKRLYRARQYVKNYYESYVQRAP